MNTKTNTPKYGRDDVAEIVDHAEDTLRKYLKEHAPAGYAELFDSCLCLTMYECGEPSDDRALEASNILSAAENVKTVLRVAGPLPEPADPLLAELVERWPTLPERNRQAIAGVCGAGA